MVSKRFLAALLVLAGASLAVPAATAQPLGRAPAAGNVDRSHGLKVSAQILPAADKQPPRLSIVADIPAGWHIYSITQKPGGPKRTIIQLPESTQFRLAGPLAAAPAPTVEREKYKDIWPDLAVEEHVGRVTWTAPLEVSAGVDVNALTIEGHIKAFMCSEQCVDVTLPFVARISPTGSMASVGGMAKALSALAMAAPAAGEAITAPPAPKEEAHAADKTVEAPAPMPSEPKLVTPYITLTGQLDREVIAAGETATLALNFQPKKGWHIYPLGDIIPLSGGWPTRIVITDSAGIEVGPPVAAKAKLNQKPGEVGGVEKYYQGPVQITLSIRVPTGMAPGTYNLSGAIGYQTCEKQCKQPTGASFMVPVTVGATTKPGSGDVLFANASYPKAPATVQADPQGSKRAVEKANAEEAPLEIVSINDPSLSKSSSLMFNLLLAFLGGLVLNAMPCVLPVIGLKIMSFVQQAGESPRRVFVLNVWFTAGVLTVFLALAALVSFTSFKWGTQFQQPEFRIVMAAVLFVFALSLLGVWEIPLPGFVGSSKAYAVTEREGPSGAYFKGLLSTVLATPCIGPFMVGALTFAIDSRSAPLTFGIFTTMGLGMAAPYLLIGAKPSLLRWLPKPGVWMETFKQAMGFLLLASVIWLFWVMQPQYFVPTLALLFGLGLSCWWMGRTPLTAEFAQKLRTWAVAVMISVIIGGASFKWLLTEPPALAMGAPVALTGNPLDGPVWQPFSPALLNELRARKITVLVDFTAKWCLVCQTNKGTALHTVTTEKFMRDNGIIGLVADKTDPAPEIDQLMLRLKHDPGLLPFYAVYPGNGGAVVTHDQGPLSQGTLLKMFRLAGPTTSHSADTTAMKPAEAVR